LSAETPNNHYVAGLQMKSVVTVWAAVAGMYLAYLPMEAAKSLFMDACDLAPLIIPKMRDQKSLALRWRSFSWCGRGHADSSLAYNDREYSISDSLQPFTTQITKDAKPKIVDTLLMLIFMMEQGACRFLFVLQRWPILHVWQPATSHDSEYKWFKTNNRWWSVDAHFNVLSSQNLLTLISVFIMLSAC
jgi:hypothetical protein